MGQSLNPVTTHSVVPDDVKEAIPPIDYTPCTPNSMQTDADVCQECGEGFGFFSSAVNCSRCGRQMCYRCCPERHLLKGNPGCQECTAKAYRIRRAAMLEEHYRSAGVAPTNHTGSSRSGSTKGSHAATVTTHTPAAATSDASVAANAPAAERHEKVDCVKTEELSA